MQSGRLKPLSQIISVAQQRYSGRVIDVELELDDAGRHIYELKLLDDVGRRLVINVDAATGVEVPKTGDVSGTKPLAGVLREVLATNPGRVLEAELEPGPGARLVYEVRIIATDGRLREVIVDARSGRVLQPQSRRMTDTEKLKPAADAIDVALARYPGEVLEVELELDTNGRRYYEVELRLADGRTLEVHVDAETLTIIAARGLSDARTAR